MTMFLDRSINFLKWPIGLLFAINMPWAFLTLWELVSTLIFTKTLFFLGIGIYTTLWYLFFSSRFLGSAFPTFVHESLHAIVALATFHTVRGFKVTWKSGGQVKIAGGLGGNWMVLLAPYCFPLTLLLMWISAQIFKPPVNTWTMLCGVLFGFEIIYVLKELHWKQSDLQRAGWLFCVAFLPAALALNAACVLSFMDQESIGLQQILTQFYQNTLSILSMISDVFVDMLKKQGLVVHS